MILQDWSTCTVSCGGGSQTQQRACFPPKNGGKPCSGDAILTRPCNKDPCPPQFFGDDGKVKKNEPEEETAPLKLKMMRITDRPQRYEVFFNLK